MRIHFGQYHRELIKFDRAYHGKDKEDVAVDLFTKRAIKNILKFDETEDVAAHKKRPKPKTISRFSTKRKCIAKKSPVSEMHEAGEIADDITGNQDDDVAARSKKKGLMSLKKVYNNPKENVVLNSMKMNKNIDKILSPVLESTGRKKSTKGSPISESSEPETSKAHINLLFDNEDLKDHPRLTRRHDAIMSEDELPVNEVRLAELDVNDNQNINEVVENQDVSDIETVNSHNSNNQISDEEDANDLDPGVDEETGDDLFMMSIKMDLANIRKIMDDPLSRIDQDTELYKYTRNVIFMLCKEFKPFARKIETIIQNIRNQSKKVKESYV
jgi:hypothetical protein